MRRKATEYEYSGRHLTQSQIQTTALDSDLQRAIDLNTFKALENDLLIYDNKFTFGKTEAETTLDAGTSSSSSAGGTMATADDQETSERVERLCGDGRRPGNI